MQKKHKLSKILSYFPMTATMECFFCVLILIYNFMPYYQALFYWIGLSTVIFTREVIANLMAQKPPYMMSGDITSSCG
jgi:hypothetical protein